MFQEGQSVCLRGGGWGGKKSEGQNDNKPRSKQTISGDHHGVYSALQGNKQNKENVFAAICRARLHSNDVGAKSMDKGQEGSGTKKRENTARGAQDYL